MGFFGKALAKLKGGVSVACFGFPHDGEMIADEDAFEPRLARLKVFLVTVADLPGQPRLLHVRAELPKNLYGSAVVNADGKVLGLYAEAAAPPSGPGAADGAGLKNMHYITLINPTAIDLGLRDPGSKAWLPAANRPRNSRLRSQIQGRVKPLLGKGLREFGLVKGPR